MSNRNTLSSFALILSVTLSIGFSADIEAQDHCQVKKWKERTANLFEDYCNDERLINTENPDPNAEVDEPGYSSWFFEIPEDQKCDLGLEFPDLMPNFDFGFEGFNVCNIIQKVSANAVSEINEEFDRVEGIVNDVENGVNEYGEIDLNDIADDAENDLNEYFNRRPNVERPNGGGGG